MMTHFKPLTIAIAALLATAVMGPALAQANSQMDPTTLHRWTMMDTNNDSYVSMAEHARAAKQMFIAADTNHDGMLSKQEARAHPNFVMNPQKFAQWWQRNDTNGDGALSMDEYGVAANRMYRLADTNNDGRLDKDEWAKAMATRAMGSASAQTKTQMDPTTLHRWTMMDTNNDSYVSMAEHARAAKQMFIAADTNHDGMLSKQEARAHPNFVMNPQKFAQWWQRNDTNGDGVLSMDEYGVAANRMYRLADTNNDGRLDKDEWTKAMATARRMHGYGLTNSGH